MEGAESVGQLFTEEHVAQTIVHPLFMLGVSVGSDSLCRQLPPISSIMPGI